MKKLSLPQCADALLDVMRGQNYSEGTLDQYRRAFKRFIEYCNSTGADEVSQITVIEFASKATNTELVELAKSKKRYSAYKFLLRAGRILEEYFRTGTFTSRFTRLIKRIEPHPYWGNTYSGFMNHIHSNCDYAKTTIDNKEATVRKTINILSQRNINSVDEIDTASMEAIVSHFIHRSSKSVAHRIGEIKMFFQYCFDCGLSKNNLALQVPMIAVPHVTRIPVSWTVDEAKKLLNSIERNSPAGKRDYALLLLACTLGLRAVDLLNLELSDFDWERKTITVRQKKTRNTITLPLLNDVGWAIIDYIRNGRPETNDKRVFVRLIAPYNGFTSSSSIERMFTTRVHEAGLRVSRKERYGIHSLRHTLGSVMLEKGTPLQVISQVLGHRSIESTETYLRINMKGLSLCPIDPEKVFEHEV